MGQLVTVGAPTLEDDGHAFHGMRGIVAGIGDRLVGLVHVRTGTLSLLLPVKQIVASVGCRHRAGRVDTRNYSADEVIRRVEADIVTGSASRRSSDRMVQAMLRAREA
jgi:hypothetical protein